MARYDNKKAAPAAESAKAAPAGAEKSVAPTADGTTATEPATEDPKVMAARHAKERQHTHDRHDTERAQMHGRHEKDFKALHSRHMEEITPKTGA